MAGFSDIFYTKPQIISAWLNNKGYTGSVNDQLMAYFKAGSGLTTGTIYDHVAKVMSSKGYSGRLADQLAGYMQNATGQNNRKDAERAFFLNNSLSFTSNGIDSFTKLMLHMDGANGGTTFTDSASPAKTLTAVGNAVTSTSQIKFGTASGAFPAAGDHVTIPNSVDFNFGSGDFTIDTWFYQTALPSVAGSIFIADTTNTTSFIYLRVDTSGQVYADFNGGAGGGGWGVGPAAGTAVTSNQWVHVALVRFGNRFDIYINGVSGANATNAGSITDQTTTRAIGGVDAGGGDRNIIGFLDEFRISKGVARWTSNFTPPTQAYS